MLVTGDNIYTAKAIALECGILQIEQPIEYPVVVKGRDFASTLKG